MRRQRVNGSRDVCLFDGLAGEEDEHVASGLQGWIDGSDGRQGMFALVVDNEQSVEEILQLSAKWDALGLT